MTSRGSSRRRLQDIKFRVLVVGRGNSGKTTLLQRVCDTTESPKVYRIGRNSRKQVQLDPSEQRGQHDINDELIFENNDGYIFHDSCGFESGSEKELKTIQDFVRKKAGEKRLKDRLHAIWYCIPMDNSRPSLDMKYFNDVCPDKNVPVIAVFTKYDQFRLDVEMRLEDEGHQDPTQHLIDSIVRERFEKEYIGAIRGRPRHVLLEGLYEPGTSCQQLLSETADAVNEESIAVMFPAAQKGHSTAA